MNYNGVTGSEVQNRKVVGLMNSEFVRMTFTVTPDMEALMAQAKRSLFYDATRSEMIRSLIRAGLAAAQAEAPQTDPEASGPGQLPPPAP